LTWNHGLSHELSRDQAPVRGKRQSSIDSDDYWHKHDRLPPREGMCSGSRDLFNLWEITDNSSEPDKIET